MKDFKILNGPLHGRLLQDNLEHEDGTTLHVPAIPPIRQYPDDSDVRFMFPVPIQKYLLQGKYAYYLGEEVRPLDVAT